MIFLSVQCWILLASCDTIFDSIRRMREKSWERASKRQRMKKSVQIQKMIELLFTFWQCIPIKMSHVAHFNVSSDANTELNSNRLRRRIEMNVPSNMFHSNAHSIVGWCNCILCCVHVMQRHLTQHTILTALSQYRCGWWWSFMPTRKIETRTNIVRLSCVLPRSKSAN